MILPVLERGALSDSGTDWRVMADLFGKETEALVLIYKLVGFAKKRVERFVYKFEVNKRTKKEYMILFGLNS
mgnify:CR=1 FL=1